MKSACIVESLTYSDSSEINQSSQYFETPPLQSTTRSRKKYCKLQIKHIKHLTGNIETPLEWLYHFKNNKQALRLWTKFDKKQVFEELPGIHFTSVIRTGNQGTVQASSAFISPRSLVLIHPLLKLNNLEPVNIYMPTTGDEETPLKFQKVCIRREIDTPTHVQVSFETKATNIWYQEVRAEASRQESSLRALNSTEQICPQLQPQISLLEPKNTYLPASQTQRSYAVSGTPPPIAQSMQARPELTTVNTHSSLARPQLPSTRPQLPPAHPQVSPVRSEVSPPAAVYQEGFVAICKNCGIESPNLYTCVRCKKPTQGKVIRDPAAPLTPVSSPVKKSCNKKRDEVVVLSSDEESEEKKYLSNNLEHPTMLQQQQLRLYRGAISQYQNGMDSEEKPPPEKVIKVLSDAKSLADACSTFAVVTCSYIRIGNYKVGGKESPGLALSATLGEIGIYFQLPGCKTGELKQVGVPKHQILNLTAYHSQLLFFVKISTGPKLASWVRETIEMDKEPSGNHYFCPLNGDENQKHIVLMFSDYDETKLMLLTKLYKDIIVFMENHEAVAGLAKDTITFSNEPLQVKDGKDTKLSCSTRLAAALAAPHVEQVLPQITEDRKLFHYPLADLPSNSEFYADCITVNNTDIICLANEQFLNDQIVDFWLRHVVEELTPTDKDRTYVYNTFFYKRLTTKPKSKRKSVTPWEFDPNLTPAEKRHQRVKSWTKKVDIFKKDFLFIPINENFHWYLVVICFPGLVGTQMEPVDESTCSSSQCAQTRSPARKSNGNKCTDKLPESDENTDAYRDEAPADPEEAEDEPMETTDEEETQSPNPEFPPVSPNSATPSTRISDITVKRPCIVVFDSLGHENRGRLLSTLRDYLRIEYKTRKAPDSKNFDKVEMIGCQPSIPKQSNNCDCGLYVLQYAESFFEKPITNFTSEKTVKLRKWFNQDEMTNKRRTVYNFIIEYVKTNFPENSQYIPVLSFPEQTNAEDPSVY